MNYPYPLFLWRQGHRAGLRAIPPADLVVPAGVRFCLTVQATAVIPVSKVDWISMALNDMDGLNGRTVVSASGQVAQILATNGQSRKGSDLYSQVLSIVDNYVTIADASLIIGGCSALPPPPPPVVEQAPPRTISPREPIVPRDPIPRPLDDEPDDDPVIDIGNPPVNGNTPPPSPTTLPAIDTTSGTLFGIETKYLLIGAVALFFVLGKK